MTDRADRSPRVRVVAAAAFALAIAGALATAGLAQDDFQKRRGFSITITAPENQEYVLGRVKIAAELEIPSPDDLDRVEFYVGDDLVFVDREAPFEAFHEFPEIERSFIIRAVAHHVEGLRVSDAVVTQRVVISETAEVNRVLMWLSVTDGKDEFVLDLDREDFTVKENGKPQRVIDFYHEDRPIRMAILLDSSGSMYDKLEEVHKAAESFVATLREDDRALVIDFDDRVFLIQDLTGDGEALAEAVTSTEAIGGTALFDAIHAAYRKLDNRYEGRTAIVLLSDGDDTASQFGFKRILEEAKTENTIIYSIGVGNSFGPDGRRVLRDFAAFTGGRAFFVKKAEDLAEVYERIAEELRSQYFLSYSTSIDAFDGRWVKLEVESAVPNHKVKARRGFFAVKRKKPKQEL